MLKLGHTEQSFHFDTVSKSLSHRMAFSFTHFDLRHVMRAMGYHFLDTSQMFVSSNESLKDAVTSQMFNDALWPFSLIKGMGNLLTIESDKYATLQFTNQYNEKIVIRYDGSLRCGLNNCPVTGYINGHTFYMNKHCLFNSMGYKMEASQETVKLFYPIRQLLITA